VFIPLCTVPEPRAADTDTAAEISVSAPGDPLPAARP
jgi:hypothetical protein